MSFRYTYQLAETDLDYPDWVDVTYKLTFHNRDSTISIARMFAGSGQINEEFVGHAVIITKHRKLEEFGEYGNLPHLVSINVKYKRQGLGRALMQAIYHIYGALVFYTIYDHLFQFYHSIGANMIDGEPYGCGSFAYGIEVPDSLSARYSRELCRRCQMFHHTDEPDRCIGLD